MAQIPQPQAGNNIEITTQFADENWVRYMSANSASTPAHLLEWRSVISDTFPYESVYLIATRSGSVCGVLPAFFIRSALLGRHLISMPYLNSGGICADDKQAALALINAAQNIVRENRARHLEMRCLYPPLQGVLAREHKVRLVMDLPESPDDLWNSFRSEIRNRVKCAQKSGLTVEFGCSCVDDFYSVFSSNMRDLGVPVHPKIFFEAVLSAFPNSSELAIVKSGNEVIGGAILIYFRDTLEVPWISSSRSHFKLCPNNILYWEIMRRGCERGVKLFDFGRSTAGSGPAVFKMRWGARTEQLYWQYILADNGELPSDVSSSSPKFRVASAVWSRLPIKITNYLGPKLITHLPG